MLKRLVVLFAMCLGTPSYAQAIADGGFDAQGAPVSSYCYDDACPSGTWSEKHFIHSGEPAWGSPVSKSGGTMGFVQSTFASLGQSFQAASSGSFVVSWSETGRPVGSGGGGVQTVLVQINGVEVGLAVSTPGGPWKLHYSNPFQLSAGQGYTLRLTGTATTDETAFIDDVAIVPASAAASTTTYSYDALGRLTRVSVIGGANAGVASTYSLDRAGNRTRVTVTGAP